LGEIFLKFFLKFLPGGNYRGGCLQYKSQGGGARKGVGVGVCKKECFSGQYESNQRLGTRKATEIWRSTTAWLRDQHARERPDSPGCTIKSLSHTLTQYQDISSFVSLTHTLLSSIICYHLYHTHSHTITYNQILSTHIIS